MTISLAYRPAPTLVRTVWVDPAVLIRFAVHDAGVSGRPYPELIRDGVEGRAARNAVLRSGLCVRGWLVEDPATLHVDRLTGLARLRDGNHRTRFAVEHGLPRVPVRIVPARVPARETAKGHPYRGEFDNAPTATN